MTDPVIQVDNLSKRYVLGRNQESGRYQTLRESLTKTVQSVWQRPPAAVRKQADDEFWALRDVSFTVGRGEVVGIIGRNGAGKSTLLKVLSRITEPTTGRITLKGRVASLLEVGTGFHPELTGRENIFLNGAILGMHRREIRAKFDEIVAFAEVERFLDTPVKRYSSGMYVRLAFAVAAHLEPEILIVDEVLAVGDAEFQSKCLGKLKSVATSEGRTVLFVSHNMGAVQHLCGRCILLNSGQMLADGKPADVIADYMRSGSAESTWQAPTEGKNPFDNPYFCPTRIELRDTQGAVLGRELRADEELVVYVEGHTMTVDPALVFGFAFYSSEGQLLFWTLQTDTAIQRWPQINVGNNRLKVQVPAHVFNEGDYRVELMVTLHYRAWICQPQVHAPGVGFKVHGGLSESPYWQEARPGLLAPILAFENV